MIFFILFSGLILRLVNLNQSLWLDEAVQAVTAKNSLAFAFEELKGDFHPQLFHLLMHYWVRIFGSSEVTLRMPSVLFGVGTILVVYKIANTFTSEVSPRAERGYPSTSEVLFPTIATLFLATAPFHIYYSQEARMYSMVTFFTACSYYFFLRLLKDFKGLLKDNKGLLFVYLVTTTLALYSDYYALLVVLAQFIAGVIILRKKFLKMFFCYIAILLLFLPALPLLISQLKTGIIATAALPAWGKLVNINFLMALPLTFIKFSIGRITIFDKKLYALVMLGILGIFGGVGGWGFRKFIKSVKSIKSVMSIKFEEKNYLTVLLWFIVPILGAWLASLFVPNYQPFRLLLVLPAFYLLLAYGVSRINTTSISIIVAILVLAVNTISFLVYYRNPYFYREDWQNVAGLVKQKDMPIVISAETFNWPLVYYGAFGKGISVVSGSKIINLDDEQIFLKKVVKERELLYTPYLADLYDPQKLTPQWFEESGFVKIKEVSFNQVPIWFYQKLKEARIEVR